MHTPFGPKAGLQCVHERASHTGGMGSAFCTRLSSIQPRPGVSIALIMPQPHAMRMHLAAASWQMGCHIHAVRAAEADNLLRAPADRALHLTGLLCEDQLPVSFVILCLYCMLTESCSQLPHFLEARLCHQLMLACLCLWGHPVAAETAAGMRVGLWAGDCLDLWQARLQWPQACSS